MRMYVAPPAYGLLHQSTSVAQPTRRTSGNLAARLVVVLAGADVANRQHEHVRSRPNEPHGVAVFPQGLAGHSARSRVCLNGIQQAISDSFQADQAIRAVVTASTGWHVRRLAEECKFFRRRVKD